MAVGSAYDSAFAHYSGVFRVHFHSTQVYEHGTSGFSVFADYHRLAGDGFWLFGRLVSSLRGCEWLQFETKLVGIWLTVSSGLGAAFRWRMMENQSGGSPVTCNRVLGQFSANHTRKREHLVVGM